MKHNNFPLQHLLSGERPVRRAAPIYVVHFSQSNES